MGVASILVKKSEVEKVDCFNENLNRHEDFELWCKLASQNDLHYLPKETAIYRIRPGSLTHSMHEPTFFGEEKALKALQINPILKPYTNELKKRYVDLLIRYYYFYRKNKDTKNAFKSSYKLIKTSPLLMIGWKMLLATSLQIFSH